MDLVSDSSRRAPCRHKKTARSRRTLLWGLVVFLGLQCVLALSMRTVWPEPLSPLRYARTRKMQRRLSEAAAFGTPELVVLLGSSRVEGGMMETRMSRCLSERRSGPVVVANYAQPGGCVFRSALVYDRLRRDKVQPNLVLIEILPPQLNPEHVNSAGSIPSRELDAQDRAFFRTEGIPRPDLDTSTGWGGLVPCYSRRINLLNCTYPKMLPTGLRCYLLAPEENAWRPQHHDPVQLAELARGGYQTCLKKLAPGGTPVAVLSRLLNRLAEDGVPAALFVMPEGPRFRSWYPRDRWDHSCTWLASFARTHGVALYDLRLWGQREDDFLDSHHLYGDGAERFSERFSEEVVTPLLRREAQYGTTAQ